MIDCFVFSGGGSSLFEFLGIMKSCLDKKPLIWENNKNIRSIYSTSAGSLIAYFFLLHTYGSISFDDICNYFINRSWNKLFSTTFIESIYQIYKYGGIFTYTTFRNIFIPILSAIPSTINITLNTTFLELYNITSVDVHFITFKCYTFETIDISYHSHPNLNIIQALYMSCALPGFFRPYIYENDIYIDGGFAMHYPWIECVKNNKNPLSVFSIHLAFPQHWEKSNDPIELTEKIEDIFYLLQHILQKLFMHIQKYPPISRTNNNNNLIVGTIFKPSFLREIIYYPPNEHSIISISLIQQILNDQESRRNRLSSGCVWMTDLINSSNNGNVALPS